ncbi:MAG TPA: CBS domain-containing protein [Candidatus Bilamarchaeaceae archaeon]|nr:CBS domain-containing protein [Candidatus Bilamarchaeaceae archaeon]
MGSDLKVGDVMMKTVVTASTNDSIEFVAKLMKKNNVGSIIVVDGTEKSVAKGIITERDIVYKLVAQKKNIESSAAKDVMSKPLRVVKPETTLEQAATAMRENKIKRLPVVNDKNELIGILSEGDIMRIFPSVIDLVEEKAALH